MTEVKKRHHLFLNIIRDAYCGNDFTYKGVTYRLKPTLVRPYDFVKKKPVPKTDYERLMNDLDPSFKDAARTEIYRAERGWIARGIRERKIRRISIGKDTFLIPFLSRQEIGIDTSGLCDISGTKIASIVLAFCFLSDPEAGYVFLEKHLCLLKSDHPIEFKWRDLNPEYRKKVDQNFRKFLNICCEAVIVLNTNALLSPIEKPSNVFKKLVEGCFSGYEEWRGKERLALKERLSELINGTPIHCDADFSPLTPEKIVGLFARTIDRSITPLYALSKSHESIPIQLADIIVGAIRTKIQHGIIPPKPLSNWPFDTRYLKKRDGRKERPDKRVKAYSWIARGLEK